MGEQEPYAGLATTFDTAAELYEQARPGYPEALFADLAETTGLVAGPARALEVGTGTGKATRGLLARGWQVVGLEPGRELATVARRVLAGRGDVRVLVAPFERWEADESVPFDLVFAATAWHWLDPEVAYRRAAELLRPGGHLAIVATEHVSPAGGDDFFRQVQRIYAEVGMGDGQGGPQPPETIAAPDAAAMAGSGFFASPTVHRYVWSRDYTADEYLAVLSTYSNHIAAEPWQRRTLFDGIRQLIATRPAGTIRKHYLNTLQVAARLD
ncbi:class I SAM-dependent methyltransferase [Verrucosispora sioxanthis]|uniref:Class I SAM-dependent methyltransferase n=1 Tax=Verrucosispora sioxanthis TaxID=2499994 RepID=A0A6M1KVT4_9ACTN|nr:class I SAM-dependent methyltransferase [Verrucosispora sioxanthis]NEE62342.1 class I SAM-dependent methyltransferase [Verrucosispora sioxanthis]NGM11452.1 class I SAM-dependent methyltransferase [Verrucosispora sioxanthis]